METPKQKKGNFVQYEMENGTCIQVGGSGNKSVNFSTAILKPDKGKVATFKRHSHPGHEVMGVIYGEIKVMDKLLTAGECAHIPVKKGCGVEHEVEVFEESYIWAVTFNPPDLDFPTNGGGNGLDVLNKIIVACFKFIGV